MRSTLLLLCLLGHQGLSFAQVSLGSASPFGALSYATVTNTGPTVIDGDIGTTGTSITGFPPGKYSGSEVTSTNAQKPLDDAHSAYTKLQAMTGSTTLTGDLGGRTLAPGVYNFPSSAGITGKLTLAGTGSDSDSWVFQIGSTLITGVDSSVVLTGGASPCNVFWAVGSSTTLGVGTNMSGIILSLISATLNTNAISHGNIVAIGGSVTMDTNHITAIGGSCADIASSSSNTTSSSTSAMSTITTSSSAASPSSSVTTSTSTSSNVGSGPGNAVDPTTTTSLSSTSLTTMSTSRTPCSTTTTAASTTSTLLPVPTGPSFYPGNAQYTLMGCFAEVPDNIEPNRLLNNVYTDSALTAESCLAFAAANGYKYAGLEYAQECWYGNTLNPGGVMSPWASCTSVCTGNKYEYCGSGLEMVLYEVGGTVISLTPTISHPSSTSSASISTPSVSQSSSTPGPVGILAVTTITTLSSTSGTPTSSSSGVAATLGNKQTVGAYTFQGCYTESTSGRALSLGAFYDYTAMTIEQCAANCAGYSYFGVEYGGECYCGNKLNAGSVKAPVADCNFICPGSQYEFCGAGNRLNVYLLSSSVTTTPGSILPTASSTPSSSRPTSTQPSVTQNLISGTTTSCLCPLPTETATSIVYSTSIIYTTMTSP